MPFTLVVRFVGKDEAAAKAIDRLVKEVLPKIRNEAGTLVYTTYSVIEQPQSPSQKHVRVFYEVYKDRKEHQKHVDNVKAFLEAVNTHLAEPPEVTFLDVIDSK